MNYFFTLLRQELWSLLISPVTYCAATLFMVLMGLIYLAILEPYTQGAIEALPMELFFQLFWIPVFFVVPLLTMRSFSEDKRTGILESLKVTRASVLHIVLSKFTACFGLYAFLWLLTLSFPLILSIKIPHATQQLHLFEQGPLIGGYSFVLVSGLFYIALGIFLSSLTSSQLASGLLTFGALFIFTIGANLLSGLALEKVQMLEWSQSILSQFNGLSHLDAFSKGVLDSQVFIFYLTGMLFFLGSTVLSVES